MEIVPNYWFILYKIALLYIQKNISLSCISFQGIK